MREKVITGKKIIFSHSVAKDHSKKLSTFISDRFYSVNQSHNSAIVIGSSLSHQDKDIDEDRILDSSGACVTTDKTGVINGARVTVNDGLGGGAGDPEEDKEIHRVSHWCCEAFLGSEENMETTLASIGSSTSSKHKDYDAHASMAAFTYKHEQEGHYSGEFANIGDGLIIIMDKHHKIKNSLCARHIYRGFNTWTPASVQMFSSTANKDNVLIRKTLALTEGDIIVSMTDGIWGELATHLISETEDYRDLNLDQKSFEDLLGGLGDASYPSTFSIAQIITNYAMSQSFRRRQTLVELIFEMEQQNFPEKSIKTVSEALAYLDKTGQQKTANTLKDILFHQGLNDGVVYSNTVEIPLEFVMQDLKKRTVGDCSTINVHRVPYQLDELIRCFIIHPQKRLLLLPKLEMAIKSEANLDEAFKRLSREVKQTEIDSSFSELHFKPTFKKEVLDKTHAVLLHYYRLSPHLSNKKHYQQCLTHVKEYLAQENSWEKDEFPLLLSLLDSKLKPQKGIFHTFLGVNQKKLYKEFRKQVELQFLGDESNNKQQLKNEL